MPPVRMIASALPHSATAMDNGALPAGDWRIYRLNGTLQEIGQQPEPGHYSLARMARLVDWVSKAETDTEQK